MSFPPTRLAILAVAVTLFANPGARAEDDETTLSLDQVPAPVLATARSRFPDGKILETEREKFGERDVYEIALDVDGREVSIVITPEGEAISLDREIDPAALPARVLATIEKKHAGSSIEEAEEVVKIETKGEAVEAYEVTIETASDELVELKISPAGKILGHEKKESEAGD